MAWHSPRSRAVRVNFELLAGGIVHNSQGRTNLSSW